jgi:hypothetical protein
MFIVVFGSTKKPHNNHSPYIEKNKKVITMKKTNKVCKANEAVLYRLRKLMCGVINNKHDKSKGFQFALLHKNFDEAEELIWNNTQRLNR